MAPVTDPVPSLRDILLTMPDRALTQAEARRLEDRIAKIRQAQQVQDLVDTRTASSRRDAAHFTTWWAAHKHMYQRTRFSVIMDAWYTARSGGQEDRLPPPSLYAVIMCALACGRHQGLHIDTVCQSVYDTLSQRHRDSCAIQERFRRDVAHAHAFLDVPVQAAAAIVNIRDDVLLLGNQVRLLLAQTSAQQEQIADLQADVAALQRAAQEY